MRTAHRLAFAVLWTAAGWLSGCSPSAPLVSRRTTVGTLEASVSHLEYENDQLRREVAQLKSQNREIEDQLVQEEAINGELSAKLDNAENQLGGRGVVRDDRPRPSRSGRDAQTLPAGQSNRRRRKAPFAQIPGRIDDLPTGEPARGGPGELWDPAPDDRRDVFGPQSWREDPLRWLPIAQDATSAESQVR
jgi:hypothetical protein